MVETRNVHVEQSRRTILELLDSAVELTQAPEFQAMLDAEHERLEQGWSPDDIQRSTHHSKKRRIEND